MASSAFSFHCMICFEEFDPETNYPVVLPCGHTYVCVACANRLDKCMECRTPLTVKVELPPPLPGTPGTPPDGFSTPRAAADVQKENASCYADRVRNSAGFRRRYGYQYQYNNNSSSSSNNNNNNNSRGEGLTQPVKQRLPLPKNAVLLSLIQASEPARRRAEVEAPPTPQKTDNGEASQAGPSTPSRPIALPKFSRSSPLLFDARSGGDQHSGNENAASNLVGSMPDDEEHKIRVGTYLEGGPCGTYAVAAKGGLLVYPTLFEHALPSGLNGMRREEEDGDAMKRDVEELVKKHRANVGTPAFDNLATLAAAGSEEAEDDLQGLASLVSLTISEDGSEDDAADASARILPVRRTQSIQGTAAPPSMYPLDDVSEDDSGSLQQPISKSHSRHLSHGSYPKPNPNKYRSLKQHEDGAADEFDRPLIRLKYGDRVQVVSMDARGWVKLARGYGYIRLENDKQLVKVGGTSDKACQIEAMLHELSMERNRLKQDQTKLEHLSAGLMIDLQSSLLASDDDQVVVSAPKESLRHIDSESNLSLSVSSKSNSVSLDDINVSNRSKITLMPLSPNISTQISPTQLRTTKSHSPGRVSHAPPTPPHGQVGTNAHGPSSSVSNSPMRVNFRTGLSGHRALTSSHSHPHDFIESQRGPGAAFRSMSNHSGISMKVYYIANSFWDSPCTGGV